LLDAEAMQQDLDRLGEWAHNNRMPFNVKKCKVLHIGKTNPHTVYTLMDKNITEIDEEKDLGVFFNSAFKPTLNCNRVSKSANKTIGLIKRCIINRSAEGMMTLYKTLVRPKLDYCIPVCRPYLKKDIKVLEKVQKRFTKLINGCKEKSMNRGYIN